MLQVLIEKLTMPNIFARIGVHGVTTMVLICDVNNKWIYGNASCLFSFLVFAPRISFLIKVKFWKSRYGKIMILLLAFTLLPFPYIIRNICANGVISDSVGPVASGRGATNLAHIDNGVLIHDNPAGLVNMPAGKQLDASLMSIFPEIRYEDPQNLDYSKHEIFIIPTFSFIYKRDKESRLAFGVGSYIPAGFSTEYHLEHHASVKTPFRNIPIGFGNQLYRSEASLIKILFATSCRVNNRLSMGLSIGPSFQSASLETPFTLQTGRFAGLSFLSEFDADGFGLSYSLGLQYKISEKTTLGLAFVSESKTTLRGKADVLLPDNAPGSNIFRNNAAEYDVKSNFEWPRTIGLGISHRLEMYHRFSLDILWFDWASAYDRLDIEFTDGNNASFNRILGATVNDAIPLDWESGFSIRFGYEYFYRGNSDNVFRFGYSFDDNPIPDDTLVPLIPGNAKHGLTIGYSHKWENWKLNIASVFTIGDRNFVNNSKIIGGDFNNSSVKSKGYLLFLGMGYQF